MIIECRATRRSQDCRVTYYLGLGGHRIGQTPLPASAPLHRHIYYLLLSAVLLMKSNRAVEVRASCAHLCITFSLP